MGHRPPQHRFLRLGNIVADAGADTWLPIKKAGVGAFLPTAAGAASDWAMRDRLPPEKIIPSAISPASAIILRRSVARTTGGQPADIARQERYRAPKARISPERLARHDAHANMARPVRDADAELEAAAGHLVDIGRRLREFLDGLRHKWARSRWAVMRSVASASAVHCAMLA